MVDGMRRAFCTARIVEIKEMAVCVLCVSVFVSVCILCVSVLPARSFARRWPAVPVGSKPTVTGLLVNDFQVGTHSNCSLNGAQVDVNVTGHGSLT